MEAKKEARKTGNGTNKDTKKRKRIRIWPPEYKWKTPNEVLTWERGQI